MFLILINKLEKKPLNKLLLTLFLIYINKQRLFRNIHNNIRNKNTIK